MSVNGRTCANLLRRGLFGFEPAAAHARDSAVGFADESLVARAQHPRRAEGVVDRAAVRLVGRCRGPGDGLAVARLLVRQPWRAQQDGAVPAGFV